MPDTGNSLSDSLQGALRKPMGSGGDLGLTAALRGRHPAEIVGAMETLTRAEALAIFNRRGG